MTLLCAPDQIGPIPAITCTSQASMFLHDSHFAATAPPLCVRHSVSHFHLPSCCGDALFMMSSASRSVLSLYLWCTVSTL